MAWKLNFIVLCAFALLTVACADDPVAADTGTVVAKAGNEQLSLDQFRRKVIQSPYVKDSAFNAKRSVEAWAIESLLYQEAIDRLRDEEVQIDEQVQEYRKSLVNYIYENKLVEVNLDTTVTNEEIEGYYQVNRSSFILRENIVKVVYFKVPLKSTALEKIRKLIRSEKEKEVQQLNDLLAQHAENFFMNDSTWLYIEDVRREIPQLREQPEYMLNPGRTFEFTDSDSYFYLRIKDVKTKDAFSPLNFERANIRKFILNARKTQLISAHKQELLEKAKKEKRFVIYERSAKK
jgi:hypothetical protein